jgi:enoyl-CoA hydratase/carnithine racemase
MRLTLALLSAIRSFALEGHRFTPPEARDAGLVDEIVSGGTQAVLKRAREIAEEKAPKAREGVWGVIKVCRMHIAQTGADRFTDVVHRRNCIAP